MNEGYDYSGLYGQQPAQPAEPQQAPLDNGGAQAQPAAPQEPLNPADTAPAGAAPEAAPQAAPAADSAYPNVGSSGANTANTARTDYTEAGPQPQAAGWQAAGQGAPQQPYYSQPTQHTEPRPGYGPRTDRGQQGGYYSSFGGGGGYNGYSYSSAPQQPPARPQKKKGGAKKVLLRVLAGLCILALGFAGGFGGAIAAARMGLVGSQVVVNQVQRGDDVGDVAQGSASGTALSLREVSALVKPSVVVITTEQMVSGNYIWFGGSYIESGAGSGVVMTEDGYILTCAHVIVGAQNVRVKLDNDEEYTATVIGYDETADVAVIKIDATGLTPAVMGDSDALAVGEDVVAVGNPLGMLGNTVTNGIVSAINREVQVENNRMTLIQTNAAISPGNSGGGLFNAVGELVGIVNAKSSSQDSSGNMTDAEGLGFAIPINTALDVAQDLIDVGYVQRPVLGIQVLTIDTEQQAMQYGVTNYGVYILRVDAGSGAEAAGLRMGDRIAAVEDIPVTQNTDLTDYLAECEVGDVVTLQIERDGRLLSIDVTLGVSQG